MLSSPKATLIASLLTAISWSSIYFLLFLMHGMDNMFNDDFIFFFAKIFGFDISTVYKGIAFSFIDGALIGFGIWKLIRILGRVFIK
jgi:hypothetical protein